MFPPNHMLSKHQYLMEISRKIQMTYHGIKTGDHDEKGKNVK